MDDSTNKVTIDVAWFDELRSTANGEKYKKLEAAYNQVRKECDELKSKLSPSQNYEAVIAAKNREIYAVKEERNRLNAKVNELKAKLDCADVDRETYKDRAEAAERCIEDAYAALTKWNSNGDDAAVRSMFDNALAIIRAYREKEAAR